MLAFGFIGLFIGPALLAVGYSLIKEWSASDKSPLPAQNPTETAK